MTEPTWSPSVDDGAIDGTEPEITGFKNKPVEMVGGDNHDVVNLDQSISIDYTKPVIEGNHDDWNDKIEAWLTSECLADGISTEEVLSWRLPARSAREPSSGGQSRGTSDP